MAELIEIMRSYIEQVQDMIPGVGPSESAEEPEPAEEPIPPATDAVPTTGVVEGRLVDDDSIPLSNMRVVMGSRETRTDRNGFFFFENVDFGNYELYLTDPSIQEEVFLTSFHINERAHNYTVNLIVSLPDSDDETEEAVVLTVPAEEPDDTRGVCV